MTRSIKTLFLVTMLFAAFSCKKEEAHDPAKLDPSDFSANVDENPENGDVIGKVEVETNEGASTTYSITSQSVTGALAIDGTGQLTVADKTAFNYEINNKLTAKVALENNGITATANVEVNVVDVAELIVEDFSTTIDENPEEGAVGSFVRTYDDVFPLTFTITSQTPASALSIYEDTGMMEVADADLFDYETNPVITAEVSITNGHETVEASVTITLNDVAEIIVTIDDFTTTKVENSVSNGEILGTLAVDVTEEKVAQDYQFSLLSENPEGALQVNNNGEIEVAGEGYFNYELYPEITAEVQVNVNGTLATATITINLTDDPTESAQKRLDDGETPMQLYYSGMTVATILGNEYAGGYLATLDITTGLALILGAESASTYTFSAANTAALELSDNGYTDWQLPISDMMDAICTTQSTTPNTLPLSSGDFWTSTTCGASCRITYQIGSNGCGSGGTPTSASIPFIPVRIYEDPNVEH